MIQIEMNRNKILRHLYVVFDTNQPIQNCLQFCMNLRYFHSKCTKKYEIGMKLRVQTVATIVISVRL